METDSIFRAMVDQQASDLFLKVGAPPFLRVRGQLQACGSEALTRADLLQLADELLGPERQQRLQDERELNVAFERERIGRFRANVLWQRGSLAMVVRRVQASIPDFAALHLPVQALNALATERRGLVLITGATSNGKSTTVASLLQYLNHAAPCHIVTLEDPIEYVFEEDKAVINQREIGLDTRSFSEGLKNALRQSPDVLFLSDIRDEETMESALLASEAGQLVLSCIHTTNALTTIERVVSFFPPHQQQTIRFRLSLTLKGIISQRLLPRLDAQGQIPACEVLVVTPSIRKALQDGRAEMIPELLRDGALQGMQTMTQSLYALVRQGRVSLEVARAAADQPDELDLAVREIRATRDVRRPA